MRDQRSLDGPPVFEAVPLGGVGEFGMNMLALGCDGTTVLVDAGVMFPEPGLPGVEVIVPDTTYLESLERPIAGLILTHGHEDHIGAVPYMWPMFDAPIYGAPLTLALVERKLAQHAIDPGTRLVPVQPGAQVEIGALRVEFLHVTHSMPDCFALAVHSRAGTVIHSGDFKIDHHPVDGRTIDLHRFAELGRRGVLALFGDSTNADRPGSSGSEVDVRDAFEAIIGGTTGQVVVALFASSIHRMQILADLAGRQGRHLAFVGRGVAEHSQIAQRLGYLKISPGVEVAESDLQHLPPGKVLCLVTGSQGEPHAALSRIARDDHRHVRLAPGDVVVFSARSIPGNQRAIARVMNDIARRGADVIASDARRVHVSGHASAEELRLLLTLVRPRHFVPIHGEYRQLGLHGRLAAALSGGHTSVLIAENGDLLRFDDRGGRVAGRVPAGRVLIDGTWNSEVDAEVLRDRRQLANHGLAVPVVTLSRHDGRLSGTPEIITRGLALGAGGADLMREVTQVLRTALADAPIDERTDHALIGEHVRVEVQRFFRKRTGRRPVVVPVVLEI